MKKIFTTILSLCFVLVGCSEKKDNNFSDSETNTSEVRVETFEMNEAEVRERYMELYQEKVKGNSYFISDVEDSIYREYGFDVINRGNGFVRLYDETYKKIIDFHYPVLISEQNDGLIAYLDDDGGLSLYDTKNEFERYYGSIHLPEGMEVIGGKEDYAVTYKDSIVSVWNLGEIIAQYALPNDTKYVDYSEGEGFLFRQNGDVYLLQNKENEHIFECDVIAHNVKEIIVANYELNFDATSQPLFLMKDGSIKVYCSWYGDPNLPKDDECHLVTPVCEGGWK